MCSTNKRSDEYGGSIEARAKFPLRVLDSVVKAIGQERVGIRVSPWNDYQEMRMSDPIPTFSHFVGEIRRRYERLAYLHVVEGTREGDSNEFLRNIWHDNNGKEAVFLSAGEHNRESALKHAEEKGDVVAFGKWFISNVSFVHFLVYFVKYKNSIWLTKQTCYSLTYRYGSRKTSLSRLTIHLHSMRGNHRKDILTIPLLKFYLRPMRL